MKNNNHFIYDSTDSIDFDRQSEWFRQRLVYKKSEVDKQKHSFGKTLTLKLDPTYFLAPIGKGFGLFNIAISNTVHTKFTEKEWYEEHKIVAKTKDRYHPAYKNLCPILRNAPKNPVLLTHNSDIASSTYINSIVFTQFKDGSVSYEIKTAQACFDNNELSITVNAVYTLSFPPYPCRHYYRNRPPLKRDGTLKIDGVITYKADDLISFVDILSNQFLYKNGYSLHKAYTVIHRYLDSDLSCWLSQGSLGYAGLPVGRLIESWYEQLKLNPELYDLPFNEIELLSLYNTAKFKWDNNPYDKARYLVSILEPLRAGDTKSAIDASFYGYIYPKSIKKLLLKTGLVTYPKYIHTAIYNCIQSLGVDKTLWFLTDVDKVGEPDFGIIDNLRLIEALTAGFNIDIIKQMQKRPNTRKNNDLISETVGFIQDTMSMYERLVDTNIPLHFTSKNIKSVHNYLSNLYTFHANTESSAEMNAMRAVDTSKQSNRYEAGSYIIRSPYTASELINVGCDMSHCVAVYIRKFYYRQTDIVLLTDTAGHYLACIEIVDSYVVQAKLNRNQRLCDNTEYLAVVLEYIEQNNLKPATLDLGTGVNIAMRPNSIAALKRNEERIKQIYAFLTT